MVVIRELGLSSPACLQGSLLKLNVATAVQTQSHFIKLVGFVLPHFASFWLPHAQVCMQQLVCMLLAINQGCNLEHLACESEFITPQRIGAFPMASFRSLCAQDM